MESEKVEAGPSRSNVSPHQGQVSQHRSSAAPGLARLCPCLTRPLLRAAYGKCMWSQWNPAWVPESSSQGAWSTILPAAGGLQGAFPEWPQGTRQPKGTTVPRAWHLIPYRHAFAWAYLLDSHAFSLILPPTETLLILQGPSQVLLSSQSFFKIFILMMPYLAIPFQHPFRLELLVCKSLSSQTLRAGIVSFLFIWSSLSPCLIYIHSFLCSTKFIFMCQALCWVLQVCPCMSQGRGLLSRLGEGTDRVTVLRVGAGSQSSTAPPMGDKEGRGWLSIGFCF